MRFPHLATAVIAAALLALLAGCGEGDDDTTMAPADFAITVDHADGSVPPPHHAVWRLEVDDTGQGVLVYTPDYPGPDVPTWRAEFDVAATAADDLYAALRRHDLLGELEPASDEPVGPQPPRPTARPTRFPRSRRPALRWPRSSARSTRSSQVASGGTSRRGATPTPNGVTGNRPDRAPPGARPTATGAAPARRAARRWARRTRSGSRRRRSAPGADR